MVALSTRWALFLCIFAVSSLRCFSSPSPSICPPHHPFSKSFFFFNTLLSQCPLSSSPTSPLQVNGNFLDRTLAFKPGNEYTSIVFYASWCPFSHNVLPIFEALGSMFPQIEHLAVEQSLAMPSMLSRYGIHSFPTILLANQTSRMRFHGSKDLHALIKFYTEITGYEPVQYVAVDQSISVGSSRKFVLHSWIGLSINEILTRDVYLVLSILFLCLRVLVFVFPKALSRFKDLWVSYRSHLNLEIFGETCQMLRRIFQMIDVKRFWTKLRVCKTRNFHQGAKSARVWASSLASVSLGETSSSRL